VQHHDQKLFAARLRDLQDLGAAPAALRLRAADDTYHLTSQIQAEQARHFMSPAVQAVLADIMDDMLSPAQIAFEASHVV
jgi:hypothetical protein